MVAGSGALPGGRSASVGAIRRRNASARVRGVAVPGPMVEVCAGRAMPGTVGVAAKSVGVGLARSRVLFPLREQADKAKRQEAKPEEPSALNECTPRRGVLPLASCLLPHLAGEPSAKERAKWTRVRTGMPLAPLTIQPRSLS